MNPTLTHDQRCDWEQVIRDLQMHGMSVEDIAEAAYIPKSTLMGYKNQNAEPKHADGVRLVALWQTRMVPPLPVVQGTTRSRRVDP